MRLSNGQMCEDRDGGAEGMGRESSSKAYLSFISTGVRERERGNIGQEKGYVSRSMEGWEDYFAVVLYTLGSTVSQLAS